MFRLTGRSFLLFMVTLAVVGLLAACSSGGTEGGNTPTVAVTRTPTPTHTPKPSPTPTVASGGQLSDACGAFSLVSGLSGAGLPGGVSVSGSPSATSSLARSVGTFFERVLSDAFGGSPKAGCFFEASTDDSHVLWVGFALPVPVPSDSTSRLSASLSKEGASVAGSFTGQSGGGAFSWVMVEGLPLDEVKEGLLYVFGNEVVVVINIGAEEPEQTPAATTAGRTPTPTASAQQPPSGDLVGEFDGVLQGRLESGLGVGLTLQSHMQATSGGEAVVTLLYGLEGAIPGGTDVSRVLENVVKGLGGTVTSTFSTGGFTSVTFEGLEGDAHTATGSLLYDGGSQLSVTLQVS